jgi:outer membrane protein
MRMKKPQTFKVLLTAAAMLAASVPGQAATLLEIYQQALQSDPRIHEAEARRLAALEAEPQARGVLLPQIGFGADWTKTETSGSGVQNTVVEQPEGSGNFVVVPFGFQTEVEDETTRWQFNLRQTLFRGRQGRGAGRSRS